MAVIFSNPSKFECGVIKHKQKNKYWYYFEIFIRHQIAIVDYVTDSQSLGVLEQKGLSVSALVFKVQNEGGNRDVLTP